MGAPGARSGLWRHREAGPARARLERHYRGADATSLSLGHASASVSLDLDAQTAAEELHLPLRQCPCICLCIGPDPVDRLPLDCDLTARSASGGKDAELPTGMPPPPLRRLFCCTQCTSACDATLCGYYDANSERHHRQHECWRYCKCVAACCSGMTSQTTAYHAPCSATETRSCSSATLPAPSPPPPPFPILATPTLSFPRITTIVPPFPLPTTILPPFPCPSISISCCLCAPRPVPTDFPSSAPPLPSSTLPTSPPPTIAPFPPFPPSPTPTLTPQPPSPTLPTSAPSSSVSTFSTAPFPRPSLPPNSPPTASQTPARTPTLSPAQIIGIFAGALVLSFIIWGILLSRRAMRERALITPQHDGRTDRRSDASWVLSLRGVSGTGTFAGSLYRRIERGMSVQSGVTRRPGSEESSAMV